MSAVEFQECTGDTDLLQFVSDAHPLGIRSGIQDISALVWVPTACRSTRAYTYDVITLEFDDQVVTHALQSGTHIPLGFDFSGKLKLLVVDPPYVVPCDWKYERVDLRDARSTDAWLDKCRPRPQAIRGVVDFDTLHLWIPVPKTEGERAAPRTYSIRKFKPQSWTEVSDVIRRGHIILDLDPEGCCVFVHLTPGAPLFAPTITEGQADYVQILNRIANEANTPAKGLRYLYQSSRPDYLSTPRPASKSRPISPSSNSPTKSTPHSSLTPQRPRGPKVAASTPNQPFFSSRSVPGFSVRGGAPSTPPRVRPASPVQYTPKAPPTRPPEQLPPRPSTTPAGFGTSPSPPRKRSPTRSRARSPLRTGNPAPPVRRPVSPPGPTPPKFRPASPTSAGSSSGTYIIGNQGVVTPMTTYASTKSSPTRDYPVNVSPTRVDQNALGRIGLPINEEGIRTLFNELDINRNGFLTKHEFKRFYKTCESFGMDDTENAVEEKLHKFTSLGDHLLSYDEFAVLCCQLARR